MKIKENQTYRTPEGRILRVKTVRESGLHTLELINKEGNVIAEKRNSFGHVILRSERFCSTETIESFKKIK